MTPGIDWSAARGGMLLAPDVAYLNAGSFGPLPRTVFDRVTELRRQLAEQPTEFMLRRVPALLWQARTRIADFVGGDPRQLLLTTNVSTAINLVASSLTLAAPGEILLSDHEYVTMRWCWERAAERLGLTVRTFAVPAMASDASEIVDAAIHAMTAQTRLLCFSHVLAPTGLILPARALCAEARRRGIVTVVDGAHGPGLLELDLAELACDFYIGSGHKWLLAPTGTGFLYLGRTGEDRLHPAQVSWGYHPPSGPPDDRDAFGSTPRLRRLECEGTRDLCPWLALPEAIDFQAGLGHARIRARMRALAGYARERLARPGVVPATPAHPALSGAITAFALPAGTDAARLRSELWQRFRVEASVFERPDRLLLRAANHFFNTEAEIDRLGQALEALVPG